MEILKVEDLSFKYPDCGEPAVKNVSFSIERGEFTVLCGATGSGKSTLLRMLKPQLTPLGELSGEIFFNGQSLAGLDAKTSAAAVGFVMQKPEQQIVTDKVWHELAFGLENLGVPQETIAARVAEMAHSFGMTEWFSSDVSTLSGGRKQLLNLASVLVMRPDLLILDEPTAQLDPVAATGFIELLRRLNRDYSLTIIIAEHRLEELIPICDRLMVMENGTISEFGAPGSVVGRLSDRPELFCGMPAAARLCSELGFRGNAPLSVRDGRRFIEENFENSVRALPGQEYTHSGSPALEFRDVYFRYERDSADILDGLSLTVYSGEIFCILGGNGSGKSTFLRTAAGLLRAYSGSIKIFGKKLKEYRNQSLYRECLAMLPQDVQTVFLKDTVREELADVGAVRAAAEHFVGEHDFASFCADCTNVSSTVRNVYSFEIENSGNSVIMLVKGNGFLYNMIRIMVGTLLEVSEKKIFPDDIPRIIAAKDRLKAGRTAMAHGLYLNRVFYDEKELMR